MLGRHLSTVGKVLILQILTVAFAAFFFFIFDGRLAALHAFLGAMAAFLPNVYFALKIKLSQGQDPQKIVRSFYVGESGKLVLTVLLFIVIFQIKGIKFLPLMTGYVAVLSIFWFALILRE